MDFLLTSLNIIFLGVMVEAKYCPIEIDGDVKYYICPRNEICCTFGCCISSNFHFYQLWYYWLMVILMFLLCSGGTWWYRYWLHEGHYPSPPPPPHRPQLRRPPPTRVAYHAGRNTVVVQQIWKPPRVPMGCPTPPPSYSLVQDSSTPTTQSSARAGTLPSQAGKPAPSAYYQMYGPPPSYDSVIGESQRQLSEQNNQLSQPVDDQRSSTADQVCQTHSTQTAAESAAVQSPPVEPTAAQSSSRSHDDNTALPK